MTFSWGFYARDSLGFLVGINKSVDTALLWVYNHNRKVEKVIAINNL